MFSYSGVIDGRYRREYIHPGFGFCQTRASVREERNKAVMPLAESPLLYAVSGMSTHSWGSVKAMKWRGMLRKRLRR